MLATYASGQYVLAQDKNDSTKRQCWQITGSAVLKGGYVEYPVTWVSGGAALVSGQRVLTVPGLADPPSL